MRNVPREWKTDPRRLRELVTEQEREITYLDRLVSYLLAELEKARKNDGHGAAVL